jgi:hypothetical protein
MKAQMPAYLLTTQDEDGADLFRFKRLSGRCRSQFYMTRAEKLHTPEWAK